MASNKREDSLKFHEIGLDDRVLESIAKLGWKEPTLIQAKAIPLFLKGKDLLVRSRTGSGKTGAYLVPLIHRILENTSEQVTSTLILAPSKELCKQISEHIKYLTTFCKKEVRSIDVSIQYSLGGQKHVLTDNPDIIVGTPLKILELIQNGDSKFMKTLQYLIIDEADLMFTYDYKKDLDAILRKLPSIYQCFITSATLADDVNALKNVVLHNPVLLKLEEPPLPPSTQLTHYVIKVEEMDKAILLYAILKMNLLQGKSLIFTNSVDKCYKIRLFLGMFGIKSCVLNSELPVNSRGHIIDQFNRGKYNLLIAPDILDGDDGSEQPKSKKRKKVGEFGVSRGIDFQFVANVVNFDFPKGITPYIHRVGRTARASFQGTALSFVSSMEMKFYNSVEISLKTFMPDCECVFQDFKYNFASLDGFRYRASDAWKQCTSIAVKDYRKRELREEILNSKKLKTFFEDHPKDMEILRHDVGRKCLQVPPHLKHIPEYNIPAVLKRVSAKSNQWRKRTKPKEFSISKAKYLGRSEDPLRSLAFKGFK